MGYQALLFCPDEKLARIVSQVFSELDFVVDPVNEPFTAVKKLMAQHYDAVVVDCDHEQNSSLLLKSARNSSFNQGSLAIALVEGQMGVAKAYRIGANLVLTKPLNIEQAKGTLRVARGLLRKSSDAATTASYAASAPPAKAAPAAAAPAIQPNRSVEAIVPPAAHGQALEFEAPLPAMAASATIEEKPAPAPAPAAQKRAPVVAQAPAVTAPLASSEVAGNEITKTEAPRPAVVPVLDTASRSQGAASAPAPAKEVAAPAKKQAEEEKQEGFAEIEAADQAQANFSTSAGSMSDSMSFGILDVDDGGSGGRKKILVAAAVLALAAAGYFGWTEFGRARPKSTPQPVTTAPQKPTVPVADRAPMPTPGPGPSASSTNRPSATTTAPAPKTSSVQLDQRAAGASPTTRIAIRLEPEAKKSAPAPILVKPASNVVKIQAQAEDSSAQLPSPLAIAPTGDSDLGGVLSSASANIPELGLARIKISQGVSQGLLIKRVQPRYPANALAAHVQGAVQIEATIDKEGSVVNPKVLSGDPRLAAAALEAVGQWRYKPYSLDGEPVEIQTQITINFRAR